MENNMYQKGGGKPLLWVTSDRVDSFISQSYHCFMNEPIVPLDYPLPGLISPESRTLDEKSYEALGGKIWTSFWFYPVKYIFFGYIMQDRESRDMRLAYEGMDELKLLMNLRSRSDKKRWKADAREYADRPPHISELERREKKYSSENNES